MKKLTSPPKFYITTAIAYPNAKPHIGFALEVIQADVIARWRRMQGYDTFYLTGTDEHGTKIKKTAEEAGKSPREFVDETSKLFRNLTYILTLSNDHFIRTSDKKQHYPAAQKLWKALIKSKDIYKKKYTGLYCFGCESFKTEKDLEDGKCPNHNRKPEKVIEENYFFKLSKYQKQLEKLIASDSMKVRPKTRKNEILSFIRSGLEDVSFSRSTKSLTWGIPIPGDDDQVMYVWCDALSNYLSGIGYTSDPKQFKKLWPADVHVIGKDILRFHAAFWPAMLLSAKLPVPQSIFVHGFINVEGKKMSKTIGNVIDPVEQVNKYGADQIRYFLLREIPSDDDGNYSERILAERVNSDLADELGNLVNRALVMSEKYFDGKIPPKGEHDGGFGVLARGLANSMESYIDEFKLNLALNEAWILIREANKYVNVEKPWKIKDKKLLGNVIYNLLESIRLSAILLHPFIPTTTLKIMSSLGLDKKEIQAENLVWGRLEAGKKIKKSEILFKKIELKPDESSNKSDRGDNMITIDDFAKIDLRVAEIKTAENVEGSDKLVKLLIDLGEEEREIVAGIGKDYTPKTIVGKKIVVIANIKPREYKKFGVTSHGMLLAASDNNSVKLVTVDKKIKAGSTVG